MLSLAARRGGSTAASAVTALRRAIHTDSGVAAAAAASSATATPTIDISAIDMPSTVDAALRASHARASKIAALDASSSASRPTVSAEALTARLLRENELIDNFHDRAEEIDLRQEEDPDPDEDLSHLDVAAMNHLQRAEQLVEMLKGEDEVEPDEEALDNPKQIARLFASAEESAARMAQRSAKEQEDFVLRANLSLLSSARWSPPLFAHEFENKEIAALPTALAGSSNLASVYKELRAKLLHIPLTVFAEKTAEEVLLEDVPALPPTKVAVTEDAPTLVSARAGNLSSTAGALLSHSAPLADGFSGERWLAQAAADRPAWETLSATQRRAVFGAVFTVFAVADNDVMLALRHGQIPDDVHLAEEGAFEKLIGAIAPNALSFTAIAAAVRQATPSGPRAAFALAAEQLMHKYASNPAAAPATSATAAGAASPAAEVDSADSPSLLATTSELATQLVSLHTQIIALRTSLLTETTATSNETTAKLAQLVHQRAAVVAQLRVRRGIPASAVAELSSLSQLQPSLLDRMSDHLQQVATAAKLDLDIPTDPEAAEDWTAAFCSAWLSSREARNQALDNLEKRRLVAPLVVDDSMGVLIVPLYRVLRHLRRPSADRQAPLPILSEEEVEELEALQNLSGLESDMVTAVLEALERAQVEQEEGEAAAAAKGEEEVPSDDSRSSLPQQRSPDSTSSLQLERSSIMAAIHAMAQLPTASIQYAHLTKQMQPAQAMLLRELNKIPSAEERGALWQHALHRDTENALYALVGPELEVVIKQQLVAEEKAEDATQAQAADEYAKYHLELVAELMDEEADMTSASGAEISAEKTLLHRLNAAREAARELDLHTYLFQPDELAKLSPEEIKSRIAEFKGTTVTEAAEAAEATETADNRTEPTEEEVEEETDVDASDAMEAVPFVHSPLAQLAAADVQNLDAKFAEEFSAVPNADIFDFVVPEAELSLNERREVRDGALSGHKVRFVQGFLEGSRNSSIVQERVARTSRVRRASALVRSFFSPNASQLSHGVANQLERSQREALQHGIASEVSRIQMPGDGWIRHKPSFEYFNTPNGRSIMSKLSVLPMSGIDSDSGAASLPASQLPKNGFSFEVPSVSVAGVAALQSGSKGGAFAIRSSFSHQPLDAHVKPTQVQHLTVATDAVAAQKKALAAVSSAKTAEEAQVAVTKALLGSTASGAKSAAAVKSKAPVSAATFDPTRTIPQIDVSMRSAVDAGQFTAFNMSGAYRASHEGLTSTTPSAQLFQSHISRALTRRRIVSTAVLYGQRAMYEECFLHLAHAKAQGVPLSAADYLALIAPVLDHSTMHGLALLRVAMQPKKYAAQLASAAGDSAQSFFNAPVTAIALEQPALKQQVQFVLESMQHGAPPMEQLVRVLARALLPRKSVPSSGVKPSAKAAATDAISTDSALVSELQAMLTSFDAYRDQLVPLGPLFSSSRSSGAAKSATPEPAGYSAALEARIGEMLVALNTTPVGPFAPSLPQAPSTADKDDELVSVAEAKWERALEQRSASSQLQPQQQSSVNPADLKERLDDIELGIRASIAALDKDVAAVATASGAEAGTSTVSDTASSSSSSSSASASTSKSTGKTASKTAAPAPLPAVLEWWQALEQQPETAAALLRAASHDRDSYLELRFQFLQHARGQAAAEWTPATWQPTQGKTERSAASDVGEFAYPVQQMASLVAHFLSAESAPQIDCAALEQVLLVRLQQTSVHAGWSVHVRGCFYLFDMLREHKHQPSAEVYALLVRSLLHVASSSARLEGAQDLLAEFGQPATPEVAQALLEVYIASDALTAAMALVKDVHTRQLKLPLASYSNLAQFVHDHYTRRAAALVKAPKGSEIASADAAVSLAHAATLPYTLLQAAIRGLADRSALTPADLESVVSMVARLPSHAAFATELLKYGLQHLPTQLEKVQFVVAAQPSLPIAGDAVFSELLAAEPSLLERVDEETAEILQALCAFDTPAVVAQLIARFTATLQMAFQSEVEDNLPLVAAIKSVVRRAAGVALHPSQRQHLPAVQFEEFLLSIPTVLLAQVNVAELLLDGALSAGVAADVAATAILRLADGKIASVSDPIPLLTLLAKRQENEALLDLTAAFVVRGHEIDASERLALQQLLADEGARSALAVLCSQRQAVQASQE
ncbi:hypothetical protein CAOG_09175 [Capsaspora owczarzaki ATCC 30864]|uniref:Uncharacterized protein n=1 Tax=Capsaspora owczarzaki (strain ATCC 30864) TaxID=595528 RepID=A0A0D2X5P9_CAPO3|nr:hypothetical protein CAOG_09175 [Capsaspora owczarzaki ATCC 30864]KJE98189.1 hypothetical protein CAOG_009175 [Capsaspora owczarzaki ATCC 30864]KJE98190.1 hypothetical protein, variant [Capsaspora owczarzaki ATCC 30864]|eukprot:XP_011270889.1 hypothetical protein CAOG_09175 [Capsaspora owczarzaki ATCC 30864]